MTVANAQQEFPLVLVVPCYNEARRLDGNAFLRALEAYPWLQLLFVNDGSTDATSAVLETLRTQQPDRIAVLSLPHNSGKAEAVRYALLEACRAHEGLCGFWDADLSAPLEELPALRATFARLPDVQWVWGIRLRALGHQITRRPARHYLGRLFATVSSLLLGIASYDTQCGAKLFRIGPLLQTTLSEPFRSRWIFDVELLTRAQSLLAFSARGSIEQLVHEQPLAVWQHRAGSKVRGADFLNALRELLVIRDARAHWHRPYGEISSPSSRLPLP
jgi:glycosyltransferase involved in cell wall biosynthesis